MKRKHITHKMFDEIKNLIVISKGKLTQTQIGEVFGFSNATVCYINKADTFEDYKDLITKQSAKQQKKNQDDKKYIWKVVRKADEEPAQSPVIKSDTNERLASIESSIIQIMEIQQMILVEIQNKKFSLFSKNS